MDRARIVTGPDQGDASHVVTAAELHGDSVVLDIVSTVPPEHIEPGTVDGQPGRLELTDDLGTQYENAGGSGSGFDGVRRMAVKFRPAVPERATMLRVVLGTGTVVLML